MRLETPRQDREPFLGRGVSCASRRDRVPRGASPHGSSAPWRRVRRADVRGTSVGAREPTVPERRPPRRDGRPQARVSVPDRTRTAPARTPRAVVGRSAQVRQLTESATPVCVSALRATSIGTGSEQHAGGGITQARLAYMRKTQTAGGALRIAPQAPRTGTPTSCLMNSEVPAIVCGPSVHAARPTPPTPSAAARTIRGPGT